MIVFYYLKIFKELFFIFFIYIILVIVGLNVKLFINEIIELYILKLIKFNIDENIGKCVYNVK